MDRGIAPLAAGFLAAGALAAPLAHAQTIQQVQQHLGLDQIPDPDQDPSPPAADPPDGDPDLIHPGQRLRV